MGCSGRPKSLIIRCQHTAFSGDPIRCGGHGNRDYNHDRGGDHGGGNGLDNGADLGHGARKLVTGPHTLEGRNTLAEAQMGSR